MFPEELPKRLIKMFSFVGETVLDPFLGSGTTTLAAKKLGRNSVGYDSHLVLVHIADPFGINYVNPPGILMTHLSSNKGRVGPCRKRPACISVPGLVWVTFANSRSA